jgi:hypothetical protein
MGNPTLAATRLLDIPIREVSGLCVHRPPDGGAPLLVAIGDTTAELGWTVLDPDALEWHVLDLATIAGIPQRGQGSQFEAVATDAAERILILQEYPAFVYVLDRPERRLLMAIELVVRQGDELVAPARTFAASLGEAMLPLRDGRMLITKEKDPPLLLEVGPPGATPLGIDPTRLLAPDEPWRLPDGLPPRLEVLARWPLDRRLEKRCRDISDLAAGPDRRLYLLSDQSRRIVRLPLALPAPGEPVSADGTWKLDADVRKPEGLDFLADGRAIVAVDEKKGRHNLFLMSPAIAPSLE